MQPAHPSIHFILCVSCLVSVRPSVRCAVCMHVSMDSDADEPSKGSDVVAEHVQVGESCKE
jgi:hypothetical protein